MNFIKKIIETYKDNPHGFKKWFWRANYIVAIGLYFFTDEKILLLYTVICSVYANEESSAAAENADKNKKLKKLKKVLTQK